MDIEGKSMIQRTWEQAMKLTDQVYVATDDQRIYDHVVEFGNVVMTSDSHVSGTDRIQEVVEIVEPNADYLINLQGDEPFINPDQIKELIQLLDGNTEIASQAKEIGMDEAKNPNIVKTVMDIEGNALYFSRSLIPYVRDSTCLSSVKYFKHIGMYAYRKDILAEITQLKQGFLENMEALEQLRWLENGYRIKMCVTNYQAMGIDTMEDLEMVRNLLKTNKKGII